MDYSKVKHVKPSVSADNVTLDKLYLCEHEFNDVFSVNDDTGFSILVVLNNNLIEGVSSYRFGWIPCDENGKELRND